MCLFCSMTRRQVFRGLTAAAIGGGAQRVAAPAIRSRLAGAAGFAVLAAADASPSAAAEPVILGEGAYRYRVVEGWGALPPGVLGVVLLQDNFFQMETERRRQRTTQPCALGSGIPGSRPSIRSASTRPEPQAIVHPR
jgi:hypothetical protein